MCATAATTDRSAGTDPNRRAFPYTAAVDFRHLLDPPAGKSGFLSVRNGRFVWPSGRRARFWGVNISNRSVWVEKAEIDTVVDVLARSGANMVRFEALDSIGGLTDVSGSNSSRSLDASKLAILDYWIARLKERGIYYYLDLLDFRQFKEEDEVPAFDRIGRAARPYAFFDRRLIDLQKEYAEQLLTHRNPLTGLRYVDDPALALVEICNEHGFFIRPGALDDLVEPYATGLRQAWNSWLVQRYGQREALSRAWGPSALDAGEDPGAYSVGLSLTASQSRPRLRDAVEFLHQKQREYFREMRAHLRQIGVRVPITAVVSTEAAPDVASVAAELDFTSENYYSDHPVFDGREWTSGYYYSNRNPLRFSSPYQFAPYASALRWENKPVVIRELATVWPNEYRAVGLPEAAAYASLQDLDAVLLFGYQLRPHPRRITDFAHQADPPVWGLFGMAGQSYLRGDVKPAASGVTLRHTPDTLFRWPSSLRDAQRIAWLARLNHRFGTLPLQGETVIDAGAGLSFESAASRLAARGASVSIAALRGGILSSTTGEITRDTKRGLLTVVTPRMVSISGELAAGGTVRAGAWTLSTPSRVGAMMALSLDGRPLSASRRYVVKMVTRAENTGQELVPAPSGAPAPFHLKQWGDAPIRTLGRYSATPTRVRLNGRDVLTLALENGVWELVVRDDAAVLTCDTPGIAGTLFGLRFKTDGRSAVHARLQTRESTGTIPLPFQRPLVEQSARNSHAARDLCP